jgi:hypothetical protein
MSVQIKLNNAHPFQCFLYGETQVLVSFGVVIDFTKDGLTSTIVPSINSKSLLRSNNPDYNNVNILNISGNGVICLKITFEKTEDLLENYIVAWEEALWKKDASGLTEKNFTTQELSSPDFPDITLTDTIYDYFSPLILNTPKVSSVEIVYIASESSLLTLENEDRFNYIVDDVKLVPIACVNDGELIQILDIDYAITTPLFLRSNLVQPFFKE